MLRLPSFAESQGCKPVDECEVGTLRSLGEGGCASEGSALRSVWRGATAVRPWGSTGFPVTIAARAGAPFRAFNDMLSGTIIHVAPKRLIVQTWRSANWATTAIDSVLTLSFWPEKDGARIELVHVDVPEEDFAGVSQGWEKYYWTPWRALLNAETKRQSGTLVRFQIYASCPS